MLKGLVGFVAGAIFGLLVAIVIVRRMKVPDWVKDDFTGLLSIIFAVLILLGAGLAMLLSGLMGMLLAKHYF